MYKTPVTLKRCMVYAKETAAVRIEMMLFHG
jgi:hypothetical protein